jgi:hypothetical protein
MLGRSLLWTFSGPRRPEASPIEIHAGGAIRDVRVSLRSFPELPILVALRGRSGIMFIGV